MKKVDLLPVKQKGEMFWVLKADPREIAKLLPDVKEGDEQEAQRPWIKKKVQEISEYASGKIKFQGVVHHCKGILPSAPVLDIKEPLKVERDSKEKYYIMLPESISENQKYIGSLDTIDGQHRLRAFTDKYRHPQFKDNEEYEMIFCIFENLGLDEKRELFLITNEKQESISTNLLRKIKRWLNLLTSADELIFDLVSELNIENYSPLKNKIILGEAKIKGGWKETQVSTVLKNSNAYNQIKDLEKSKQKKIISYYLKAWEKAYNVKIKDSKHILTKISGFRYVMYFFPAIYQALIKMKLSATTENFMQFVELTKQITIDEDVFSDKQLKLAFRGEGATVKMVHDHVDIFNRSIENKIEQFDPSEGI